MNVEIFTLSISRKAGGVKDAVKDLFYIMNSHNKA